MFSETDIIPALRYLSKGGNKINTVKMYIGTSLVPTKYGYVVARWSL